MVSLAAFIIVNIARMPPCRSPTSSASASSYDMTHVGLPWMPSLPSSPMQRTALRSPSDPSAQHGDLRHDEEREALRAFRGVWRAGQDEVDDVVGQVVLAPGDEDLGPGQSPATAVDRHGLRPHRGEIGAGVGLGQVHRARPLPGDQPRQEPGLLVRRTPGRQQLDGALGEDRVERERQVGRAEHLLEAQADRRREPAAAVRRRCGDRAPAGGDELFEGRAEGRRRRDVAVRLVEARPLAVARPVGGGHDVGREAAELVEHGSDRRSVDVVERR